MASEMGSNQLKAIVPTPSRVYRLASVAYATDDITSDEKTGSAFHLGRRSISSSSLDKGRPNRMRRARAAAFPRGVLASSAASRALITPGAW